MPQREYISECIGCQAEFFDFEVNKLVIDMEKPEVDIRHKFLYNIAGRVNTQSADTMTEEKFCVLIEFAFSNHRSFREEMLFSMVAASDTAHSDELAEFNGHKVLRAAAVYGANGSGKSNFVDALAFVKNLVTSSIYLRPGQNAVYDPHKLEQGKNSSYMIRFVTNNTHYAYGFTLDQTKVAEEYLLFYPDEGEADGVVVFERDENGVTAGEPYREGLAVSLSTLKDNRLFLSCAANFSQIDVIEKAFLFFSKELTIFSSDLQSTWLNHSLVQLSEDASVKDAILKMLKDLGTGIKDIVVQINQKQFEPMVRLPFLIETDQNGFAQERTSEISVRAVYDQFSVDLLSEESDGIMKLFALLGTLVDVMKSGKVLVCDDLDSSMHESLLRELVKMVSRAEEGPVAQLIFTAHNTGLLDLDLFRKDQIWFVERKNEDRSSKLYSLVEFKYIRKDEDVRRCYIDGKYGAIPALNQRLPNEF